jgi:hypothetical protein
MAGAWFEKRPLQIKQPYGMCLSCDCAADMIVVAWNQRTFRVIQIIDAETERGTEREENKRVCKEGKARKRKERKASKQSKVEKTKRNQNGDRNERMRGKNSPI